MRVRMKVEGGDKLARKLQMIAEETARKHLRECALKGAEVIRAEIQTRLETSGDPRKLTGALAGDIQKEVRKQTKSQVEVRVGPGKKGWYGRLVEFGHAIVVGGTLVKKLKSGRVKRYGGEKVGNVPPHPFMRPAFDAKTGEAEAAFVAELKRRLGL